MLEAQRRSADAPVTHQPRRMTRLLHFRRCTTRRPVV